VKKKLLKLSLRRYETLIRGSEEVAIETIIRIKIAEEPRKGQERKLLCSKILASRVRNLDHLSSVLEVFPPPLSLTTPMSKWKDMKLRSQRMMMNDGTTILLQ
jgi:hypothetical protein